MKHDTVDENRIDAPKIPKQNCSQSNYRFFSILHVIALLDSSLLLSVKSCLFYFINSLIHYGMPLLMSLWLEER